MLTTTPAIVLSVLRHNDKCDILRAYTRTGGRINYIMYGHKNRPAPLSIVELSYDYQPTRDIQTIKSIQLVSSAVGDENALLTASRDCVKLFVAEILLGVFTHSMEDELMYDFIQSTVQDIESCDDPQNAHLRFMLGLLEQLGFGSIDMEIPTTRGDRQRALRQLCSYYAEHIDGFTTPKSLDILMEVFD